MHTNGKNLPVVFFCSCDGLLWLNILRIFFVCQGGRHVDYITDQIISKLLDVVKRKEKKGGVAIKPFQVTVILYICVFLF